MNNPVSTYQLKKQIDSVLKLYGASAVSWPTSWCSLRIVKWDCPFDSLRSPLYQCFIKDEADWLKQQERIKQELQAVCEKYEVENQKRKEGRNR